MTPPPQISLSYPKLCRFLCCNTVPPSICAPPSTNAAEKVPHYIDPTGSHKLRSFLWQVHHFPKEISPHASLEVKLKFIYFSFPFFWGGEQRVSGGWMGKLMPKKKWLMQGGEWKNKTKQKKNYVMYRRNKTGSKNNIALPALASISNSDTVSLRGCIPLAAGSLPKENSWLSLGDKMWALLSRVALWKILGSISRSNYQRRERKKKAHGGINEGTKNKTTDDVLHSRGSNDSSAPKPNLLTC